jgi:hypothetical protein
MPCDSPQLDFLFNCAISAPVPTTPGCIVVLGLTSETYLRYCRPGNDDTWLKVEVTLDEYVDVFNGIVTFHSGKLYATTNTSYCMVVYASARAPAALHVERTDVKIPGRCHINLPRRSYLVATMTSSSESGDLLFVQPYFFGWPEEVVDVVVYRWHPLLGVWREVDSIDDTTLFLGGNNLVVLPTREKGTESNCRITSHRRGGGLNMGLLL